jgi:protein-S-isoprenylcysteine O-methyltransferase Ste14
MEETMSEPTAEAVPSRIPWPPFLIAGTLGFGFLLDRVTSLALPDSPAITLAGGTLIVLAIINDMWCFALFIAARTTVMPNRAVTRMITTGPYRFSRNPIYVSHVVLTGAIGLIAHSPFVLLLLPVLVLAFARLSILPEERYLERHFGDDFRAYAARTRRWL